MKHKLKYIKKWIIIIFLWVSILIFSLIFLDNKIMILCGWVFITGSVMWLKEKDHEKFYWKNYVRKNKRLRIGRKRSRYHQKDE